MPPAPPSDWNDYKAEQIMGRLLRAGVILAAAVTLVGAICFFVMYPHDKLHDRIFVGERTDLCSVLGVLHNLFAPHPRDIMQFGILLLIATPIARVAFSVYSFLREKDRTYVMVTLLVLTLLTLSLSGVGAY